jgi:DNA-binding transcriptional ArsR family regulator
MHPGAMSQEMLSDLLTIPTLDFNGDLKTLPAFVNLVLKRGVNQRHLRICGRMGCGKTHLLRYLENCLEKEGVRCIRIAPTSLASMDALAGQLASIPPLGEGPPLVLILDDLDGAQVDDIYGKVREMKHQRRIAGTLGVGTGEWSDAPEDGDTATILPMDNEELGKLWEKLHRGRKRLIGNAETETLQRLNHLSGGNRSVVVDTYLSFTSGLADSIHQAGRSALLTAAHRWWRHFEKSCSPLQGRILLTIAKAAETGELLTAGQMAEQLGVTHNTLTHGVTKLRRIDAVTERRIGRFAYYLLRDEVGRFFSSNLNEL